MIENILGSTTKIRILRLFFSYPNRSFTTDELLKNSYVGRGYGGKCIKQSLDIGILNMKKVGKEKRYSLNKNHKFYDALKEFFDLEKSKYPTFSYLHRTIIGDLTESLTEETIIVFGSVAAGTATPESDLDLLVITDREKLVKKQIKKNEKKYGIKIQLVSLNMKELEKLIEEGSQLIKNVAKEKVFIRGQKEVLELIESV